MVMILDGKAEAAQVRAQVAAAVAALAPVVPGLHVVLVGDDPASRVYVASKEKQAVAAGLASVVHRLPATSDQATVLALVAQLNRDPAVDGILVQLPLPAAIDSAAVLEAIDPAKDVDGFHPVNVGRLAAGAAALVPCTPQGSMRLIRRALPTLVGLEAVVIGRSLIVGKPIAQLLLQADCTVTIAHSKSRDLPGLARRADILVAAVGRPELVKGDWVKPGAVVIDVGINRTAEGTLIGDVAFGECDHAAWITPVPGGVGPMTIACLLANTVIAAAGRRGLAVPAALAG